MLSSTKATICLVLFALLSVSARRELHQTTTRVSTVTRSSGRVARAEVSVGSSPPKKKEAPKEKKSNARVDVYLLLDVTESTRGTLATLRAEAKDIVEDVFQSSNRVRIGVGEYKDERDEFSFTNHQTITNERGKVVEALKDLRFRRGTVKQESQLYALERVAKDGNIGFRTKKSIKVIVWVGDTKGKSPIAKSTEKSVIAALKAKGIFVVAIDTGALDSTKQATRIVEARGGAVLKKNDDGLYDVVLLETDTIKAKSSGDKRSVTTDILDGPLKLSEAVVGSVQAIVAAVEG